MILWREAAFLTEVWPDHTRSDYCAGNALTSNVQMLLYWSFCTHRTSSLQMLQETCAMILPGKGWDSTYHFKLDHNVLHSDSGFISGTPQAEVWHLLLALKMLPTSVFHLHFLSIKSHNILWATVPKICHTWHKTPFCDGTLYLEMLLFTQTSCRLHLFYT